MTRRATVVWIALVAATALTWSVGGGDPVAVRVAVAAVVVLGFVKAAVVGLEFMELRHARTPERVAFLAWIGVVGSVCVAVACL